MRRAGRRACQGRDEISTGEHRGCVADVVDVEAHAENLRGDKLKELDKAAVRM